jgi:putative endonuclease
MYNKKELGNIGEKLACQYLEKEKYKIIEKNFRCSQGEIDIIAYDINKKEIVFFEVKTRTNFNYGNPSEAINKIKKLHIKKSMEYYLYKKGLTNVFIRVDAIEIVMHNKDYKLNHIKGILE